jgi:hypothetical protein
LTSIRRKREPTAAILPKPSRNALSICVGMEALKHRLTPQQLLEYQTIMNRLLIAVVLAALSTPALARGEAGPDNQSYTQPTTERHQQQSKADNSQSRPCYVTRAGYNSCE